MPVTLRDLKHFLKDFYRKEKTNYNVDLTQKKM